jgi:hypothetical protein
MMAEIYREASEVVIWPGDSANGSDLAMDIIRKTSTMDSTPIILLYGDRPGQAAFEA